jgi:two-component system, NtrC family, sensor kinase
MKGSRHLHDSDDSDDSDNSDDLYEMFEPIFSATPWPSLMLGEDGAVLGASDESGAGWVADASMTDAPLRERAKHYLGLLRGSVPWLTPQEADSVRALPSGALAYERIHLRRTAWGACLVIVDQTDLRQLQAADIQTARLASLGFMVAGVCHEVTNPLTSLHSIVQILRAEKHPSQALLDKGLANIALNVKRILDISRRLVKFSRVGDEPRVRFAIDDAIEEAAVVLRHEGLLDHIELQHEPEPSAMVFGNAGQAREIFMNLFVNAAQAMAGRGRLSVATRSAGQTIEVLVSDTGPGVPAALAGRIFEPFFTTRADQQGTGLGLAISTEMALEHGGSIELRHSSPQGAVFCVTLPRGRA